MSDMAMPEGVTKIVNDNKNETTDNALLEMTSALGEFRNVLPKIDETIKENKNQNEKQDNFFSDMLKDIKQTLGSVGKTTFDSIAQPLKNFTQPFADMFGLKGGMLGGMAASIKDRFTKPKKKPKESDVAKNMGLEGTGFLYLGSLLKGDTVGEEEKGGLFEKMFGAKMAGGALAKLLPMVGKLGLVGGIIWAVVDGIRGFFKADEWGVSKLSGGLGGLLGGLSKGIVGMFKNMGKWALIGAGIGSFVAPPIGTIVGGLLGAAIGGILGLIGGERLAKAFDAIGAWFWKNVIKPIWENVVKPIVNFVKTLADIIFDPFIKLFNSIKNIWGDKDMSLGKRIGAIFGKIIMFPIEWIKNYFTRMFLGKTDSNGKKIEKGFVFQILDMITALGKWLVVSVVKSVKALGSFIWEKVIKPIPDAIATIFTFVGEIISGMTSSLANNPIVQAITNAVTNVFSFVLGIFDSMIAGAKEFAEDPKGFILNLWTNVTTAVGDFFSKLIDAILNFDLGEIMSGAFDKAKDMAGGAFEGAKNFFGGIFGKDDEENVNDAIITKTGKVIHTDPEDNIIATKNDPAHVGMNNNNELAQAIVSLANRLSELEPKIISSNTVVKSFTTDENLKRFPSGSMSYGY